MARKRISGSQQNKKTKNKYLPDFRHKPKARKGLFDMEASSKELTKQQIGYYKCIDILKGVENGKVVDEPSLQDISNFFREQCDFEYGTASMDANIFNMLDTWKKVMKIYKLNQLEVLQLVAKMFVVFEDVVKELNLTDTMPSVSLFKRQFIVEKIINFSGKKFDSFY